MPELITCRTSRGDVECPGLPTPVPGLYVVEDLAWRKAGTAYAVVHESGLGLGSGFASPEGALAAAEAVAGILDWRMSAAAIRQRCLADERVNRAIRDTVTRWGGRCCGPEPTPADLRKLDAL